MTFGSSANELRCYIDGFKREFPMCVAQGLSIECRCLNLVLHKENHQMNIPSKNLRISYFSLNQIQHV